MRMIKCSCGQTYTSEDNNSTQCPDCRAWYEAEDIGCECTKVGIESEWVWQDGHYVCGGCNTVQ